MREVLEGDVGVDKRLPCFVGLSGFEEAACNIILLVYTTPRATRDWGNFRQSLLFRMHSIITQRGASLTYPTQVCGPAPCVGLHQQSVKASSACLASELYVMGTAAAQRAPTMQCPQQRPQLFGEA